MDNNNIPHDERERESETLNCVPKRDKIKIKKIFLPFLLSLKFFIFSTFIHNPFFAFSFIFFEGCSEET